MTVKTVVDDVSKAFREHDKLDPRLDADSKTSQIVQQQYKGYKETDPTESYQKAIPMSMLRKLFTDSSTQSEQALGTLAIGVIFLCMH